MNREMRTVIREARDAAIANGTAPAYEAVSRAQRRKIEAGHALNPASEAVLAAQAHARAAGTEEAQKAVKEAREREEAAYQAFDDAVAAERQARVSLTDAIRKANRPAFLEAFNAIRKVEADNPMENRTGNLKVLWDEAQAATRRDAETSIEAAKVYKCAEAAFRVVTGVAFEEAMEVYSNKEQLAWEEIMEEVHAEFDSASMEAEQAASFAWESYWESYWESVADAVGKQ